MKNAAQPDIEALFKNPTLVRAALRQGVQDALRRHKLMNLPVYVMKDGKPTWLPPEEIQLDSESPGNS